MLSVSQLVNERQGLELLSDEDLRTAALGNWVQLNKVLRHATDAAVARLLELELRTAAPRSQIVHRLYGKLAKARLEREKRALNQLIAHPEIEEHSLLAADRRLLINALRTYFSDRSTY